MHTFVSMLRGINVSGQKVIKMTRLKALYESVGFADVTTYIQSGNVIFGSSSNDPSSIGKMIAAAVEKSFGFSITVIIRRSSELGRVIRTCPFIALSHIDESKLHVTFLNSRPAPALVKTLGLLAAKTRDEYKLVGSEIYLHCPDGYGKTVFSNAFFEKHLNVAATTRNWRTVNTLFAMAGGRDK
jgi:uncharacterized protein (DUF1697 family)